MILVALNLSQLVLADQATKQSYMLEINYFHFQGHTKDNSRSKENVLEEASYCTCLPYTWLWGLLEPFTDLFYVCPPFLVMMYCRWFNLPTQCNLKDLYPEMLHTVIGVKFHGESRGSPHNSVTSNLNYTSGSSYECQVSIILWIWRRSTAII